MKSFGHRSKCLMFVAALLLPALSQAHPGHATADLMAGFAHPLQGADHLLALLAVGLLAARVATGARWLVVAAFAGALLIGATVGLALQLQGSVWIEIAILASLPLFGLALAFASRVRLLWVLPLTMLLASAHGLAHGIELPPAVSSLPYLGALTCSSLLISVLTVLAATRLRRHMADRTWARGAGLGLVLAGAVLGF
jgi:urease accessory protein